MDSIRFLLVFLISLVILITTEANDAAADTDRVVWRRRELLAKQAAREAYQPNPHVVVNHLNQHVHL